MTIPPNVIISDWLPQNDMLAQSKVKVFITHCGNNGQYEAIFHGVPMVGMPIYGDQHYNARRIVHKGYGLEVDIKSFTPPELVQSIREVMENPTYREQITRASHIFHDRPESPAERASSGIEHVLTFGGEHMHSVGSDMPLYQFLMLDVVIVMCLGAFLATFVVKWVIGVGWKLCCRASSHHQKLKAH